MERFKNGDEVRIDIPDRNDPDFRFHRERGEVIKVLMDDAGLETGDKCDSVLYRVKLQTDEIADFRWRDLRPAN